MKMSARSGKNRFKGGRMPMKRGTQSIRNKPVYVKQLDDLPDYSTPASRDAEL